MAERSMSERMAAARNLLALAGKAVAIWTGETDGPTLAERREAANSAVQGIDTALTALYRVRADLVGQMRRSDDAFMAELQRKYGPLPPAGDR
ncbi:hypothetical protein [Embleya scabrispora]|uniref:hypothetical protein n=1 Tax=Embleya scabrispora TaxID=159449 RepID=UPI000372F2F3|nr:hypothetical protein [Embleya scabrispora]MYS86828.1 hypothetical protein [Streptomyces sp. SID5474]